jgi:hypothetical protein
MGIPIGLTIQVSEIFDPVMLGEQHDQFFEF